ncbi:YdjY domain-containing protein [Phycisphaerales bacterium AB-hyl4]|uniref:YdjY domain-containing protein n=1 Tax=Natronomicrosphaera hydrolytica TaxID=3242702 RepID=A0ABV4U0Y5_9BACT
MRRRQSWIITLTMLIMSAPLTASWAEQADDDDAPLPPPPLASLEEALPGVTVDLETRQLELEAVVVLRDGDWLELLVCSPQTREHESILTVEARPSHIHLALLLLGYQPGSPMQWEQTDDGYLTRPPQGELLSIYIAYEDDDGEEVEVPATDWIRHEPTGETMAGNVWLFAGSVFERIHEQNLYVADLNGTIVSLVNFGDDLIARPTQVTDQTDEQRWNTYTERIPETGTSVKLRIRPYDGDADDVADLVDAEQELLHETPPPPGTPHDAPPEVDE